MRFLDLRHRISHTDKVTFVLNIENSFKTRIIDINFLSRAVGKIHNFIIKVDEYSIELISSSQNYMFNY